MYGRANHIFECGCRDTRNGYEALGSAAFEVGDDKAGVSAFRSRFDAGDGALDPVPALGRVVELDEAAQLAAVRRQFETMTWRQQATLRATLKTQFGRLVRPRSSTPGGA